MTDSKTFGPETFALTEPYEYRGQRYESFTLRRPKVRDLRDFLKNVDRDAIFAMEKVLAQLAQVDDPVIAELGIKDFSTMKKWFESFLQHMMIESED